MLQSQDTRLRVVIEIDRRFAKTAVVRLRIPNQGMDSIAAQKQAVGGVAVFLAAEIPEVYLEVLAFGLPLMVEDAMGGGLSLCVGAVAEV